MITKLSNKKWVTLIELIIVVWIIFSILFIWSQTSLSWFLTTLEKQSIKDWIVNINNEVRNYSYNSITLNQDVINDEWKTNTEVSRLDWVRNGTNVNTKLAYYHALYFTTKTNDSIDSTINTNTNLYFYLLQYRQEWYSNFSTRTLEPFLINYDSSIQLLKSNWGEYCTKKIKIPTVRSYYLNKIIDKDWNCETDPSIMSFWYILYSNNNLNYKFYRENTYETNFDYKFCFSTYSDEYEEEQWIEVRLNREKLNEYFFESLQNY